MPNPLNHQTILNKLVNDTIEKFVRDYGDVDLDTILLALEDAKTDAPAVLRDAYI